MRCFDRLWSYGRKISAQFLTWLGAFDQHTARLAGDAAVASQEFCAVEQSGRALDTLERDGPAADRDRRLADIQRADGLCRAKPASMSRQSDF